MMELNPNKVSYVIPAKLDDANIIEFPCKGTWDTAQKLMYRIKVASNELGLRNGRDYLFLPRRESINGTDIRIWYADQSMASQILWHMHINE